MTDTNTGYLTEERSVDVATRAMAACDNDRLRAVMGVIVRHLHDAVKEIEPTREEWMQAITFLTETGHKSDDWRQEFILLSDTLGVSMLVDAINSRRPTGASENTVLGPFHVAGAPRMEMGESICRDGKGEPMVVRGRVTDTDGAALEGVTLDVWQANDDGFYDVQQKGIQPDFNLRGTFTTAADGQYWFKGAKPKYYPIPDDGPVGQLLGHLGRHPYRPAHLHYIVSKPGFDTLTTHIFDRDDPYIGSDAVFGVKQSLLARFARVEDPDRQAAYGFERPFYEVTHDFVLARLDAPHAVDQT